MQMTTMIGAGDGRTNVGMSDGGMIITVATIVGSDGIATPAAGSRTAAPAIAMTGVTITAFTTTCSPAITTTTTIRAIATTGRRR